MKFTCRMLPLFSLLLLVLAACGGTSASGNVASTPTSASVVPITLNVFAAASLTESFKEIQKDYHAAHPNIDIIYNFNGSQALAQQLSDGAAGDIFASADQTTMQKAVEAGIVTQSQVFAQNKLVVIIPASNPGHIASLKDLAQSGTKLVVGAPAVPVGKYGLQMLDTLGAASSYGLAYEKSVKANIVSQEENVKAVVQKVQLGEADAGIVYQTDVTTALDGKVTKIEIPDEFNVLANYPVAVTKGAAHSQEAQDFVTYLLSAKGQATLTRYHFLSINK